MMDYLRRKNTTKQSVQSQRLKCGEDNIPPQVLKRCSLDEEIQGFCNKTSTRRTKTRTVVDYEYYTYTQKQVIYQKATTLYHSQFTKTPSSRKPPASEPISSSKRWTHQAWMFSTFSTFFLLYLIHGESRQFRHYILVLFT